MILRLIKELYLTAFTIFFRISGWSPKTNRGCSAAVITLIESVILMGIASLLDDLFGTTILVDVPKWKIYSFFFALGAVNCYVLIFRRHGIKFEHDFTHFEKSKKIFLVTSCLIIILTAVILSFYAITIHRNMILHR
jgi:hypothetical protein